MSSSSIRHSHHNLGNLIPSIPTAKKNNFHYLFDNSREGERVIGGARALGENDVGDAFSFGAVVVSGLAIGSKALPTNINGAGATFPALSDGGARTGRFVRTWRKYVTRW